ncbi:aldolase [Sphingomonadales bacterium EhC05]|nr:aldolase [Sphingomonadales bacterium EhC05]
MTVPRPDQQLLVQQAARALGNAGLVHAYGHCSLRLDQDHFLVCAAMPMGLISDEPGTVVPIDGALPESVLGEVRIHQNIYRLRADVKGVCRIMSPAVMALSTQGIVPKPRHGIGAYFSPDVPLWDDPRLLRNDEAAQRLAKQMGENTAIIMRGNGAVVVADDIKKAVTLSWFLEDAARMERATRMMGFEPDTGLLSPAEVVARQVFAGGVVERMWAYLGQG